MALYPKGHRASGGVPSAIRTLFVLKRIVVLDVVVEESALRARLDEGLIDTLRHAIVAIEFACFAKPDAERLSLDLIDDAADCGRRHDAPYMGLFRETLGSRLAAADLRLGVSCSPWSVVVGNSPWFSRIEACSTGSPHGPALL